jgi:hypothetical protein
MRTMMLAAAAVAALGVGAAYATQTADSDNLAAPPAHWTQLNPTQTPTAQVQVAYIQAPFHASEDNGQG